ncbi:MAG: HAMP domain-containing histidine kinase [Ruminococcus sp.]|uniref:sensor histidine kinase n=1 Tax=Ruminococcus sp. TaxID=41978 RepID=UPI0025F8477E|nr:HAMP domain-containing sensor histidine kinase [Ruminococcus sp.]MCR5600114.1 HAMP domain-containing histidine kinase [Ruminococcus sp.]
MILKKRISRVIAFIISCVITGVCLFQFFHIVNDNVREIGDRNERTDVLDSDKYTDDMNYLFDQLWALSNIYLRNTDKTGKYTCSKDYEKSLRDTLSDLELITDDGKVDIKNPTGFEYYASCGDRVLTNTKMTTDELKTDYSMQYVKGWNSVIPKGMHWLHGSEKYWYTTNYGMTYYGLGGNLPLRAVAIFDFDTTGLDSYRDYNGAEIFYKTDGSTPVPGIKGSNATVADREAYNAFNPDSEKKVILPSERYDENGNYIGASNNDGEETYTEINDMADVTDTDVYMFYDKSSREWFKVNKNVFTQNEQNDRDITIYIKPTNSMIAEYEQYSKQREDTEQHSVHSLMMLIPFAVIAGVIALILLVCCGYNEKEKKFTISMMDKIFAELPVLLIIGAIAGVVLTLEHFERFMDMFDKYYPNFDMSAFILSVILTSGYAVGLGCIITLVTRIKCREFWKNSLTGRIILYCCRKIKKVISAFDKKHLEKNIFTRRFIIRTAIAVVIELFIAAITLSSRNENGFLLLSFIALVGYVFLSIRDHEAVASVAQQISDMNGGDYSPRTVADNSPAYSMTNNLNNISDGIKTAVDKQVQSERMKIELVTNVSHDLKTPLTSIISYIDLLSAEDMSPAAKDYVAVISQKSDRLKSMVSDLFDLAKAASRTDVNSEQIDAVILTQQVLGDMADKINSSGRDVRTDISNQSAPVVAEGKKLYRVLQNLIDNALKYSMDGTRIYVTLVNDSAYTNISVKNISAEEMNFTPEEITERFTRGDKSRTTEGNGLGLSIAKSFTEACGGIFEIVIDGDMFTANVKLPLI